MVDGTNLDRQRIYQNPKAKACEAKWGSDGEREEGGSQANEERGTGSESTRLIVVQKTTEIFKTLGLHRFKT